MQVETLAIRVSSPTGMLWQGNLRVSQNQGASYSQNLSHALADGLPTELAL